MTDTITINVMRCALCKHPFTYTLEPGEAPPTDHSRLICDVCACSSFEEYERNTRYKDEGEAAQAIALGQLKRAPRPPRDDDK